MWPTFFATMVAEAFFAIAPGFLILRAFQLPRWVSICIAPGITVGVYTLVSTALSVAGFYCNWVLLFGVSALIGLLAIGISSLFLKKCPCVIQTKWPCPFSRIDALILCGFVMVGVAITGYVYIKSLDGPCSFLLSFDNSYHLGRIANMLQFGNWSTIGAGTSIYYGDVYVTPNGILDPQSLSGFYPSGWHIITAMVGNALNTETTLVINASTAVFIGVFFPLGMYCAARSIFGDNTYAVACTGACMMCFTAFQGTMITSALTSNLASMCLMPGSIALFIWALSPQSRRLRINLIVVFFFSLISIAATQPNCLFSLGIFLLPFCIHRFLQWIHLEDDGISRSRKLLLLCAFILLCIGLWLLAYTSPLMHGTIFGTSRPAFATKAQALVNIVDLSFRWNMAQPVLAIAVGAGAISCLKHEKLRWLVVSYAIMCFFFFVCASSNGFIDRFLTGFWYTDQQRVAAAAALFAIPIAGYGLGQFLQWSSEKLVTPNATLQSRTIVQACIVAVFLIAVLYPSYSVKGYGETETAFGSLRTKIASMHSENNDSTWYSAAERKFIKRVAEIVGRDDVVLNIPADGSAFAYGVNGLKMRYRTYQTGSTNDDKLIREKIAEYASNKEVQQAIHDAGIKYILFLDYDNISDTSVQHSYKPEEWLGMNAITDNTPGMELILKDGDMRLYKINDKV